jgi:hypothetical protein
MTFDELSKRLMAIKLRIIIISSICQANRILLIMRSCQFLIAKAFDKGDEITRIRLYCSSYLSVIAEVDRALHEVKVCRICVNSTD